MVAGTALLVAADVASAGQEQDRTAQMAAMAALLNAMLDQQKSMRNAMRGGAQNKEMKMCSMTEPDEPAASSEEPAHVHP
jgi:hypothetical protein